MRKQIEVPYFDQSIKYPTGCESVTAVMLLHFLGFPISIDDFIDRYLEKEALQTIDGVLYGPDPNECFVGSPYDEEAFGCYAPVIKKTLEKILPENAYEVINETGSSIDYLISKYIDQDMPVIFWACINMREPITGPEWRLSDSGDVFTWISNEHCMLLVGYDEEQYYFNDPYENHGVIGYAKEIVKSRYDAQHCQAIGVQILQEL
ncbi:MAG: C39 family peptidase [Hespellia sp.]|nr:C39 family peptidase [Hespellia sp.]